MAEKRKTEPGPLGRHLGGGTDGVNGAVTDGHGPGCDMLILSGEVSGQRLLVHYTFETNGLVHDFWILRPEEAARQPWPTTPDEARRWLFNPDAQVWSRR